jgi:hypothetical protein
VSKNAERMSRDLKTARGTMDHLSEALINDLVRRAGTRATTEPTCRRPDLRHRSAHRQNPFRRSHALPRHRPDGRLRHQRQRV